MSFFDTLKNLTVGTIKAISQTDTGTPQLQTWEFQFDKLPKNLEELQALNICDLTKPQNTAAMTLLALCVFPESKEECYRMIEFLNGPTTMSPREKQFLNDRFMDDQGYVPFSYFEGSVPGNDYTPDKPYRLIIKEQAGSRDDLSVGYITLYFKSGGADSARHVRLRRKESTGEWFLYEQFLMVGIRKPVSKDPWA